MKNKPIVILYALSSSQTCRCCDLSFIITPHFFLYIISSQLWIWSPTLRATSHTRLKAHDRCNLRALIGRKGGDRPSSLRTRQWRPRGSKKTSWMKILHGGLWIRFHGLAEFLSGPPYYIKPNPPLFFCQQDMRWSRTMVHSHFTQCSRVCDYLKLLSQHHGMAFGWESRVLTITRSQLLARVWSDPKTKKNLA